MKKNIKNLFFAALFISVFFSYNVLALDDNIFPKDSQSFSPPSGVRANTSSGNIQNNILKEEEKIETEEFVKKDDQILVKEEENLNRYPEIKSISIIIPIFIVCIILFFSVLFFLVFNNLRRN